MLGRALAVAALYLLWKRRKPKAVAAAADAKAQVAARRSALMLFKMLRSLNYPQQGKFREYFVRSDRDPARLLLVSVTAINALDPTANDDAESLSGDLDAGARARSAAHLARAR